MDLLTYLQRYDPEELVHFSGNTYTTRTHNSLKISNVKWYWWSRGIGGTSALDYLVAVHGLFFMYIKRYDAGEHHFIIEHYTMSTGVHTSGSKKDRKLKFIKSGEKSFSV